MRSIILLLLVLITACSPQDKFNSLGYLPHSEYDTISYCKPADIVSTDYFKTYKSIKSDLLSISIGEGLETSLNIRCSDLDEFLVADLKSGSPFFMINILKGAINRKTVQAMSQQYGGSIEIEDERIYEGITIHKIDSDREDVAYYNSSDSYVFINNGKIESSIESHLGKSPHYPTEVLNTVLTQSLSGPAHSFLMINNMELIDNISNYLCDYYGLSESNCEDFIYGTYNIEAVIVASYFNQGAEIAIWLEFNKEEQKNKFGKLLNDSLIEFIAANDPQNKVLASFEYKNVDNGISFIFKLDNEHSIADFEKFLIPEIVYSMSDEKQIKQNFDRLASAMKSGDYAIVKEMLDENAPPEEQFKLMAGFMKDMNFEIKDIKVDGETATATVSMKGTVMGQEVDETSETKFNKVDGKWMAEKMGTN